MPRRRSFGTISELPSGRYRARYVGPDGVKHSGPHPFYDYGEARAWLNTEERLLEKGEWASPKQRAAQKELEEMADITVGQWLQQWLEIQSRALKPSTMQNYRAVLDRRVYKAPGAAKNFQHLPLASLTPGQVMRWWDALEATYGRQQENHSALRRLSTALKAALERELLPINPAAGLGIKRPKSERKELPTYETMRAIVDELEPRHRIIGVLTFFHGLRIGEVLALRRMDIDVTGDQAVVHVRGSAYRDNAGGGMVRLETPKTDAGVRDVPVFPEFVPMIKEHLEKFAPKPTDAQICVTALGKVVMDTSYRCRLATAKKRAGVEGKISPHYGRVWLITTLAEAGMPIPAIGRMLGQVDLKTITEIYLRATEQRTEEVLDRVNASFRQGSPAEP